MLIGACSKEESKLSQTAMPEPPGNADANSSVDPLPTVDRQSPDMVVKSHWALQDWVGKNLPRVYPKLKMPAPVKAYYEAHVQLAGGEYQKVLKNGFERIREIPDFQIYDKVVEREIVEIKNESATRAVVVAKIRNVTPIPPGVDFTDWEKELRQYGLEVRYIVEKGPDGWNLTQAYERDHSASKLDGLMPESERNGGWSKVWKVPEARTGPSSFAYAFVEP